MKFYLALFLSVLSTTFYSFAQTSTFREKGKAHYDKDEYRQALYYFNRFIRIDSSDAEVFKFRGNCFFELNQLDSAEIDYFKTLKLSNQFPETYYNLANVYTQKNDQAKAEVYMRKFLSKKPDDADGLFRLSRFLKARNSDSSFFYLGRAYRLDSLNPYFYNTLAWEHYSRNEISTALTMAKKGRTKFGLSNELLPLEAYAAFSLGDFAYAVKIADTLLLREPDDIGYNLLRTKSSILKNTPRDKYDQKGFSFHLKEPFNDQKALDKFIADAKHPYFYPNLLKKFTDTPEQMSLPEFFMVYYGYTSDERYSPYSIATSTKLSTIKPQSTPEAMDLYRSVLQSDPFHIQTYESLASAALELKLTAEFQKALTQYIGLMESILASGNGNSGDSAYFVISPRHEYHIINYLGLKSTRQSLRHDKGHSYDVLTTIPEDTETQEEAKGVDIYFNIDKPWASLSSSLSGDKKKSKPKRKAKP